MFYFFALICSVTLRENILYCGTCSFMFCDVATLFAHVKYTSFLLRDSDEENDVLHVSCMFSTFSDLSSPLATLHSSSALPFSATKEGSTLSSAAHYDTTSPPRPSPPAPASPASPPPAAVCATRTNQENNLYEWEACM
jgi:hypothetical protein